jgi:hypothetical protein
MEEQIMAARSCNNDIEGAEALLPSTPPETGTEHVRPWELIDVGRYQPRRIRGSFRGRELG